MAVQNVRLFLIALIFVLLSGAIVWGFARSFRRKYTEILSSQAESQALLVETVSGMVTAKGNAAEESGFTKIEKRIVQAYWPQCRAGIMGNVQGILEYCFPFRQAHSCVPFCVPLRIVTSLSFTSIIDVQRYYMIRKAYYRLFQAVFRVVSPLLSWREPRVFEGPGSVHALPAQMQSLGVQRLLIVTDQGIVKLGLLEPLLKTLNTSGIISFLYDGTVANPTIDNVEQALSLYYQHQCQAILAFGGGSPIDCAKAVGARLARPKKLLASMRGILKVRKAIPPLFAVPTTAGTGSEVTLAAVISNPQTHEKYAISDIPLIPHFVALDAELTLGLPPQSTAATGMDALTHAIEAYIGKSNTKQTAQDALEAAKIIFENLELAYNDGSDLKVRSRMLKAAYLAGRAFTRAYVGNIHAIAHTLGGFYQVPHGLANSVILPHVLEYYGSRAEKPLSRMARHVGLVSVDSQVPDHEAAQIFIQRIREMNAAMNIPETIPDILEQDIPLMVSRAYREANPLYPVPMIFTKKDFTRMYRIISGEKVNS